MGTWEQVRWEPDPHALGPRRARRGGSFQAFIPERLQPRRWQLEGPVLADLSDAEREVAAVDRTVDTTPPGMPHRLEVLARLQLRAEALGSSQIEGLVVSPRKLALAALASPGGESQVGEGARAPLGNAAEVLGNLRALEEALRLADRPGPITVADLCAVHATLFGGGALARIGGQVRTEQNWIGGLSPLDASFVPPPPGRVPELLHDLCAFLSDDALPPLVQAAVAHAQFETIHPFADGNGRTGRALIHVVLRRRGLCRRFVPPISLVLATRGEAYVQGLMGTRRAIAPGHPEETEGWTSWIELFASATRIAVAQARRYEVEMEALLHRWRTQVRGLPECPRADAAVWPLLDWLPASPLISARDAVSLTGRSPRAIDAALAVLAQAGVLRQVGGRQRGRIWEAEGVFDQITLAERALASPSLDTRVEPPIRPVPARPAPPRPSRAKAPHPLPETISQDLILQTPIVVESDPPDDPT